MVVEAGSFVGKVQSVVQKELDSRQAGAESRFEEVSREFSQNREILERYYVKNRFELVAEILTNQLGYICKVEEEDEPKLDLSDRRKPGIAGFNRYFVSLMWYDPEKSKGYDIVVTSVDGRIEVLSILNHVEELPVESVSEEEVDAALFSAFEHPRATSGDWVSDVRRHAPAS